MRDDEKSVRVRRIYPFNFYFYEKEAENHLVVVKENRPHFEIIIKDDCAICLEILKFFQVDHSNDGPHLQITKFKKGIHSEHHEILYNKQIPLGIDTCEKKKTSLQGRLKKEFETRRGELEPLPHQLHLINHVKKIEWGETQPPFWIDWAMGSGKSLGILWAILQNPPPTNQVIIVAPKTILGYWAKSIEGLILPRPLNQPIRFILLGYNEFLRLVTEDNNFVRGQIVILDEAHQYRNLQQNMRFAIECLDNAMIVFLLTGTPLQHDAGEVEYIFRFMKQSHKYDAERTTPADLKQLLQGRVFWYDPKHHDQALAASRFPRERTIVIKVAMRWIQTFEYILAMKQTLHFGGFQLCSSNRNSYDSLTRRISNQSQETKQSPKFDAIGSHLLTDRPFPVVVFSHYKELGVFGIEKQLKQQDPTLRIGMISGQTQQRQAVLDKFNKTETDILFITNAAHQGCDIMGAREMILLEPSSDQMEENQTKNRVLRLDSHIGIENPEVVFLKYISIFPTLPPSDKEKIELQNWFEEKWLKGESAGIDVAATLQEYIQGMQTVDEIFEKRILENHKKLLPWIEAIQQASIPFRILISTMPLSSSSSSSSLFPILPVTKTKTKTKTKTNTKTISNPLVSQPGIGSRRGGRPGDIPSSYNPHTIVEI